MFLRLLAAAILGIALLLLFSCSGSSSTPAPTTSFTPPPPPSTTPPPPGAPSAPTHIRVDISDGTTGQLFVSWDDMGGASYYNLQRWANSASGYGTVSACSGPANNAYTLTRSNLRACRDRGLTVGTYYAYSVQACNNIGCSEYSSVAFNQPVFSDCTATQMPDMSAVTVLPGLNVVSSAVDPAIQFLPSNYQNAGYAASGVSRRDLLVIMLPGSGGSCSGIGPFGETAEKLGFDFICVNYSNAAAQDNICVGDPECFGNISQAKFDATGPCSVPNETHCGMDPTTSQPYVNSNPADAITRRISTMLQYLNDNGYNQNGTNWGNYLSGTTPQWNKMIIGGHSQGGDLGTFAGYKQIINRAFNLSAPPQATPVNGAMTGATYFRGPKATDIRNFYGFVSVNDLLYQEGVYAAVWNVLGFTPANNDGEVKLNTTSPIGLSCNAGTPSHNFSTSALVSPSGGHTDPLYLWNEDVFKFMLID